MIIKTFTNEIDGIESSVLKGDKGFHVTLKDTDAGVTMPTVLVFADLGKALDEAEKMVA